MDNTYQPSPGQKSKKSKTTITHTPIEFKDLGDPNLDAYTTGDSLMGYALQRILGPALGAKLKQVAPALYSSIEVNTNSPFNQSGGIPSTIHHEESHALLDDLVRSGKINYNNVPAYSAVVQAMANANRIGKGTGVEEDPQYEAPSYAVEQSNFIPPDTKNIFSQQFLQQLQKVDPQTANTWNQILTNYNGSGIQ